jgi:hypothetical protein
MIEKIVINFMITISCVVLFFASIIFNIEILPMIKQEEENEKPLVIATVVFCDVLILCAYILIINSIIEML